jgi:hypothetical protein
MRAAEFIAKSLLEAAKSAMVVFAEQAYGEPTYLQADSDEALIRQARAALRPLFNMYRRRKRVVNLFPERMNVDLDDFANMLLHLGAPSVVRGKNWPSARVYGSPNIDARTARIMGVDPSTIVGTRTQAWGAASSDTAGNVLKNLRSQQAQPPQAQPPQARTARIKATVGFTGVTSVSPPGIKVTDVQAGGPSHGAGVQAGDVVDAARFVDASGPAPYFDINSMDDYIKFMRHWNATYQVQFRINRNVGGVDKDVESALLSPVPANRYTV